MLSEMNRRATHSAADIDNFVSLTYVGFSRELFNLGAFGNGMKMKLMANLLVAIHNVSTAEALLLGLAPAIALAAWTGDASAVLAGLGCAVVALAVLRGVSHHHPGAGSQTLSVIQQVTEVAWLIGMLAVLARTIIVTVNTFVAMQTTSALSLLLFC